jgi:hypothetical protein
MSNPNEALASQLDDAYEAGDFARLRKRAAEVLKDAAAAPADKQLARSWLARVAIDRSAWIVLGFALLLFCAIVARYAAF